MALATTRWNSAEHLKTEEEIGHPGEKVQSRVVQVFVLPVNI